MFSVLTIFLKSDLLVTERDMLKSHKRIVGFYIFPCSYVHFKIYLGATLIGAYKFNSYISWQIEHFILYQVLLYFVSFGGSCAAGEEERIA